MIGVWLRWLAVGLFVGAVAVVAFQGPAGRYSDLRYTVDYPSNPGYGRADPPAGTFVDLSAGARRTCGVRTSGEIECWGDDYGDPPTGQFVKVDIWDGGKTGNACAVAADASLRCWSTFTESGYLFEKYGYDNNFGQDHPPAGAFVDVSVAQRFACGLRTDGDAVCWGDNTGHTYEGWSEVWPAGAVEVPDGPFVEVHAGHPPCGLRPDGEFVCWSSLAHEVVRQGHPFWDDRWAAVAPGWGTTDRYFRGPYWEHPNDFVCGIRLDSTLACSTYGGTPIGEFVQVDRGAGPACALRADRSLVCTILTSGWHPRLWYPLQGEFTDIAVGAHHACAIRVDGTVACWGENSDKPQRSLCTPDACLD